MQFIMVIICLLGLIRCDIFGKDISLRDKWKRQIKIGLADVKHIVDVLSTEPRSKVFNQIYLMTNFIGSIDSLAAFFQEFDPKTEHGTFKELKTIFTDMNRKLELTSDRWFGKDFREIFFELRSIEFSFIILNKLLEKLEELECTGQTECVKGMQWTINLFKNDFDIEETYLHILQASLNGTRFSKVSLLHQVKNTSGCNEKTILNFGTNLLLKLFKAQQIMVVYGRLAKKNIDSMSYINKWTQNMYDLRNALFRVVKECSSQNVCKIKCNKGKCIHLSKTNRDMCSCPNYFDGDNCQIHNQVILAKDTLAIISTLNQLPKVGDIIDMKLQTNFLIASMKCISFAQKITHTVNIEAIEKHVLTTSDLGSFYNTYLSLSYLIQDARKLIKCGNTIQTKNAKSKLMHTAYHLTKALYKMDSFFNYRRSDDTFQPETVLKRIFSLNKNEACTTNYKAKIDHLWIQFHLSQANGFSALLQVRHILDDNSSAILIQFEQRVKQQIKFTTESTCSASITHSANVHCDQFHLIKNIDIENKCLQGYTRRGSRYIKCQNITSECIPCKCNTTGAVSTICNSETGQCQCRDHFFGKHCNMELKQDCKFSNWASWSACSKTCGIGGEQNRARHIVLQQKGHGKQCKGNKVEHKKCFNRCCDGTFVCNNCSICSKSDVRNRSGYTKCKNITSACKPCKCNTTGAVTTICNPETGQCKCREQFLGKSCDIEIKQDCKWSDWTSWSACSICGIDAKQERSRHIVLPQKGSGKKCQGEKVENRTCFKRCCTGAFECKDSSKCFTGIKCQPCNCDHRGSLSGICQGINGACSCKPNFHGRRCQGTLDIEIKQDCKWSDWTSWSACSICGIDAKQERSRHIVLPQKGSGKKCQGGMVENRTCFKRCCTGAFECKDSSKCFTGIKCQPCNCDHRGSLSGICQVINGACSCKPNFHGRRCQGTLDIEIKQDCKWSDWTSWSACSTCGIDAKQERYRHIVLLQKGSGKKCQGEMVENRTCFTRCCTGAFECKKGSKCFKGIKCQPCNCDHRGSISGICQPSNGACSCKPNFHGRRCQEFKRKDCSGLVKKVHPSGVYKIFPDSGPGFEVFCDMDTDGGYWTVFQRRFDGTTNFDRGWNAYANGFGDPNAEYWLGNDKIHRLTASGKSVLRIDLEDFKGNTAYAKYKHFSIGGSSSKYRLAVSDYSGTAGNRLAYSNGMMYTTKDNDNDRGSGNCANTYAGSWWHNNCFKCNLNSNRYKGTGAYGMSWHMFGNIKSSTMMIQMR